MKKSPPKLGVYKYLMVYIALFEGFYSIWDLITEPIVHSYKAAFVVLRDFNGSLFNREDSFVLICVYCGLFGFSLAIFGVHFIYRYGAVNKGTIESHFEIPINDSSYICVYYQPTGPDGQPHPDPKIFFAIGCMWYMVGSSMFCVFYFGIRCYFQIRNTIAMTSHISASVKNLQSQLFNALVVQTIIPVVLMYIPIGILFFFPMVIWELPFTTSFVGYTIALYPAIDPLPNMIIIKFYRKAIKDFFLKLCGKKQPVHSFISINLVDVAPAS
uniref:Seven TM Receptor n=1 Tax=Caenorhabditis tropicalis TaxID=1561998 RepID=A0A1I7SXS8_9PELO